MDHFRFENRSGWHHRHRNYTVALCKDIKDEFSGHPSPLLKSPCKESEPNKPFNVVPIHKEVINNFLSLYKPLEASYTRSDFETPPKSENPVINQSGTCRKYLQSYIKKAQRTVFEPSPIDTTYKAHPNNASHNFERVLKFHKKRMNSDLKPSIKKTTKKSLNRMQPLDLFSCTIDEEDLKSSKVQRMTPSFRG